MEVVLQTGKHLLIHVFLRLDEEVMYVMVHHLFSQIMARLILQYETLLFIQMLMGVGIAHCETVRFILIQLDMAILLYDTLPFIQIQLVIIIQLLVTVH